MVNWMYICPFGNGVIEACGDQRRIVTSGMEPFYYEVKGEHKDGDTETGEKPSGAGARGGERTDGAGDAPGDEERGQG